MENKPEIESAPKKYTEHEKANFKAEKQAKAKLKYEKKMKPIDGKCIFKLPLKPRLCF